MELNYEQVVIVESKEVIEVEYLPENPDGYIYKEKDNVFLHKDLVRPLIKSIDFFEEYIPLAYRTAAKFDTLNQEILHYVMGIRGELEGEITDMLKRAYAYKGKNTYDRVNHLEELGDILWYFACMCYAVEKSEDKGKLNINFKIPEDCKKFDLPNDGEYITYFQGMTALRAADKLKRTLEIDAVFDSPDYNITTIHKILGYYLKSYLKDQKEFNSILVKNANKLLIRYPDKFNSTDATNRALESERKILE